MSKPRRRHDASRLAFGETVRHSASRTASYRSGPLALCLRPFAALGQEQKSGTASRQTRGGRGLGEEQRALAVNDGSKFSLSLRASM
jgi:hypothetical protein